MSVKDVKCGSEDETARPDVEMKRNNMTKKARRSLRGRSLAPGVDPVPDRVAFGVASVSSHLSSLSLLLLLRPHKSAWFCCYQHF
jgi:hypothetical protein